MKKKKKSNRYFVEVLVRDCVWVIKSILWDIPRRICSAVKNINYTRVKNDLIRKDNGMSDIFVVYCAGVVVLGCVDSVVWSILVFLLGNINKVGFIFILFPLVFPIILLRYVWYRADKEKMEIQQLKHNLEYFEDTNEYEELVSSVMYHD